MELLRAAEVPETPRDCVFHASRLHAILFVLLCAAICIRMIVVHWPAARASYYISGAIFILLLLGHRFMVERFHPANWLVRTGDEGLFIHIRSYLNDRMPTEDPTVIFLSYSEIRSARKVREVVTTSDLNRKQTSEIHHYVEFELAIDPSPVIAALADERARPGTSVTHWYGKSQTLYQDYPAQMPAPPFLRVEWRVVPRATFLFKILRDRVKIEQGVSTSEDFTHLGALPRERQEQRLRELVQRGKTIEAVYTARRLYKYDLSGAEQFVQSLKESSLS